MKFRITITLTKIFAFMVTLLGSALSYKHGDPQYFVTGVTVATAILGVRKISNSAVDYKSGKIESRT